MSNEAFFKLITRTNHRNRIVAVFLLLFGAFALAGALTQGGKTSLGGMITLYVLGGLCVLMGVFLIIKSSQAISQMKNGDHPLAKAILTNDQSFILWFYQQITTVNNSDVASARQINLGDRNNKIHMVTVKAAEVAEVMDYLANHFPHAMVGYTDENKAIYNQKVR